MVQRCMGEVGQRGVGEGVDKRCGMVWTLKGCGVGVMRYSNRIDVGRGM